MTISTHGRKYRKRPAGALRGPALTKEIARMVGDGFRNGQIAQALYIDERTVQYHKAKIRTQGIEGTIWGTVSGQPDPKSLDEIKDPQILECLVDTPEGFRAFFNRYSGYADHPKWPGMQPHCFNFVEAAYERVPSRAFGIGRTEQSGRAVQATEPTTVGTGQTLFACPERRIWEVAHGNDFVSRDWDLGTRRADRHMESAPADSPDAGENGATGNSSTGHWKSEVVLTVPPRHAKSETFIWFAIWRLVLDRNTRIILLSRTSTLAEDFVKYIAKQLESNRTLIDDFGRFRPMDGEGQWTPGSGDIDVAGRIEFKERSLRARGAKQQIRGLGCDWLIADDAIAEEDTYSPLERDRTYKWFVMDCESRVEPETGHMIVIGTRIHLDDLFGRLIRQAYTPEGEDEEVRMYEHIVFPALRDPETGNPSIGPDAIPLWAKISRKWLMRMREKDTHIFNANYQQQPDNPEDMWFPREALEQCKDHLRDLGEAGIPREAGVRCVHYDPGQAGYGVMFISDILSPAEILEMHVLDIERRKGLGPEECYAVLKEWQESYGPINYFIPEKNSFYWFDSHPMSRWCAQNNIIVKKIFTGVNKVSTSLGWESMKTDIAFHRIRFPYKSLKAKKKTDACFEELAQMPHGRHTDHLAALWLPKVAFEELYRMPPRSKVPGPRFGVPPSLRGVRYVRRPHV